MVEILYMLQWVNFESTWIIPYPFQPIQSSDQGDDIENDNIKYFTEISSIHENLGILVVVHHNSSHGLISINEKQHYSSE